MKLKKRLYQFMSMADYFRPSFQKETEKEFQDFIDDNPKLPFRNAKELMLFATRKLIFEVEEEQELENIDINKLNQLGKMLRED